MMLEPVNLPAGAVGDWRIEPFAVSEDQSRLESMRAAFHGGRGVPAGEYTALKHKRRGLVMSDTPDERRDHYSFVRRATGRVLIAGLGIGMCLKAALQRPEVTAVRVLEIEPDVIALVGPHYSDPRVTIEQADVLTRKPIKGEHYDTAWFDVWDDICADNLSEMTMLKRRWTRRCGWIGFWCESECRRARSRWR